VPCSDGGGLRPFGVGGGGGSRRRERKKSKEEKKNWNLGRVGGRSLYFSGVSGEEGGIRPKRLV